MRPGIVGVGSFILISACGGGGDSPTDPGPGNGGTLVHAKRVTATTSITFNPATETIPAGDSIYFTFASVPHTVTFDRPAGLNDVPANTGTRSNTTEKRKFVSAGTFNYHCEIHAGMNGQIIVQ